MAVAKKAVRKRQAAMTVYKLVKPKDSRGIYYTRSANPMPYRIGKVVKARKGNVIYTYPSIKAALVQHPDQIGTGIWTVLQCTTPDVGTGYMVQSLTPVKELFTFNSNRGGDDITSAARYAVNDKELIAAFKRSPAPRRAVKKVPAKKATARRRS